MIYRYLLNIKYFLIRNIYWKLSNEFLNKFIFHIFIMSFYNDNVLLRIYIIFIFVYLINFSSKL